MGPVWFPSEVTVNELSCRMIPDAVSVTLVNATVSEAAVENLMEDRWTVQVHEGLEI